MHYARCGTPKTSGGRDQKAVAGRVTQPVVYGLEVVEVDIDERASLGERLRRRGHRLDEFEGRFSIQT
jgi:hypothetical protein